MAKPIPDGYTSVTPNIIVDNGQKALDFYKKAFGAKEIFAMRCPETNKVMHAELEFFGSRVMLCEERPDMKCYGPKHYQGTPVSLYLYVKDCDKVFDQAVKAGAKTAMPMADQFWGDRVGKIQDPFGHEWSVATHKKDLTPEQCMEGAKAWMEQSKKTLVAA